ncbi:hypothetical protein BC830DRAFT_413393 [Chytriomyces sp. MP71]|nr:hypothetical protein BC830DRAFT_413393 [Chytriomyces sp. MP71]
MPPTKTAAASPKTSSEKPAVKKLSPAGYKALIMRSILALGVHNGSTRAAIKKYITVNFQENIEDAIFTQIIKKGMGEGIFMNGSANGPVKLVKPRNISLAAKSASSRKTALIEEAKLKSCPTTVAKKAVGRPKRETAAKKEDKAQAPASKRKKRMASPAKNGAIAPTAKKPTTKPKRGARTKPVTPSKARTTAKRVAAKPRVAAETAKKPVGRPKQEGKTAVDKKQAEKPTKETKPVVDKNKPAPTTKRALANAEKAASASK